MKIIFLNVWNGKIKDGIKDFIKQQFLDTDIFCFQEAYEDFRVSTKDFFFDYQEHLGQKYLEYNGEKDKLSQITYVKNNLKVVSAEVLLEKDNSSGIGLDVCVNKENKIFHVLNFHGFPWPGGKLDNKIRLKQSLDIIDFYQKEKTPKVIGGDFNLMLRIKSISIFEENGYRNLIKDYQITTTRNHFVWDRYPHARQNFSDYVFVSSGVEVHDFSVPNVEISDHLPMILSFDF